VNSIIACYHTAKLCAYAVRDFRSQQHVAGSTIVLQCLATITKSVIVYWSRHLSLVNWIR